MNPINPKQLITALENDVGRIMSHLRENLEKPLPNIDKRLNEAIQDIEKVSAAHKEIMKKRQTVENPCNGYQKKDEF